MSEAEEIIQLRDRERTRISNYYSLCQDVADLMFPRDNNILSTSSPGSAETDGIFDVTARQESENMASGILTLLAPANQEFFALRASRRDLNELESVRRYLDQITEITHEELFVSNFYMELPETLRSLICFGTGNMYSEWSVLMGLNYTDYDIAAYQMLQNAKKRVDTMILTLPLSARQAVQEFGAENVGKSIREMANDPKKYSDTVDIIHIVRPRKDRNRLLTDIGNAEFECLYVAVKDKMVIEGVNPNGQPNRNGFYEFPFAACRWTRRSNEVHGRGIGTEMLPQVRLVNRIKADFVELANRWARPPKEVLESFDGDVNMGPDALNYVTERQTITSIEQGAKGDFIITKDMLEFEREVIKEAFFKNVLEVLGPLKGDRRTQLEIAERLREGLKKLSNPIGRVIVELFNPVITRTVLLLARNGRFPPAPPELQGQGFKVDYIGPLVKMLRDQQIKAFEYWLTLVAGMESVFPGAVDNVDYDRATRDLGESLGVKYSHIRPVRERDMIRQQRQQMMEQQQALQAAQVAAQGYKATTKAPEAGSAAEQLQGAMS